MKNIWIALCVIGTLLGCTASEKTSDYKVIRDEVMEYHDLVMADHGLIVGNQMKLDTILNNLSELKSKMPDIDTTIVRTEAGEIRSNLVKADDAMNDWMHNFEPDVEGKSNEEAVKYFTDEKRKIAAIDSTYKSQIRSSNEYLKKVGR